MPVVIRCSNCGEIFYIGYNIIDLNKFISSLELCRYCGKKLDLSKDIKIVIKPVDED